MPLLNAALADLYANEKIASIREFLMGEIVEALAPDKTRNTCFAAAGIAS